MVTWTTKRNYLVFCFCMFTIICYHCYFDSIVYTQEYVVLQSLELKGFQIIRYLFWKQMFVGEST